MKSSANRTYVSVTNDRGQRMRIISRVIPGLRMHRYILMRQLLATKVRMSGYVKSCTGPNTTGINAVNAGGTSSRNHAPFRSIEAEKAARWILHLPFMHCLRSEDINNSQPCHNSPKNSHEMEGSP